MTEAPAPPLLIVSLPARDLDHAVDQCRVARSAGADLAELRFDRWTVDERRRTPELFPAPLGLVATLRSHAEGGEGPDDPRERRRWIAEAAQLPFTFIDLEAARDWPVEVPPAGRGWILSSHLDAGATASAVRQRLIVPGGLRGFSKVVVPASVETAVRELAPALPPSAEGRRTLLTTGASGPLLRAWSRRLQMPAVYARLPAASTGEAPVEAAQLPVDRMRWFFDGDERAPVFAVLGHPIAHSLSPALHSHWMRSLGHRGLYVGLDLADEAELATVVEQLRAGGFRGFNVTHPYKSGALALADRALPAARACGCANTLLVESNEVVAENTDLLAMLRRLEELRRSGAWRGRHLTVLGTGGSARATLAAARELKVAATVVGRREAAVRELAESFGATPGKMASPQADELLVNATTVGRADAEGGPPVLGARIGAHTLLLDWVYRPDRPSFARAAEAAGAEYEDGRRLLAYSAAASYELWWGQAPDAKEVESALAAAE